MTIDPQGATRLQGGRVAGDTLGIHDRFCIGFKSTIFAGDWRGYRDR